MIVTDADLNEVATSPELSTTEWRITKPLPGGRVYSWQVTASKDGVAVTSPVLPATTGEVSNPRSLDVPNVAAG